MRTSHWLRERTAEERAWERAYMKRVALFERVALAFGFRLRPR